MSTAAPLKNTAAKSPLVSNSSHAGLLLQRKCSCGKPATSSFSSECGECNKNRLQKKLRIGASNDPLEQEADRVADQVLAAPAHSTVSSAMPSIQRFTGHAAGNLDIAPPIVDHVLSASGSPLDPALQQDMGQSFGHDFSQVRVHTSPAAEQSARDVNAHAYTVGNNIVFGAGQFSPRSNAGQRLLAHELAHVLQQQPMGAVTVQAQFMQRRECKSDRKCSESENCAKPDADEKGDGSESKWHSLTVNVDVEADDFESALMSSQLGHTHVRFAESNGTQYSYGFYPSSDIPNENKRSVPGCVNHPDTKHDVCTDRTVTFFLKKEQYLSGLEYAQKTCQTGHFYGIDSSKVSYTCTTFAANVAKAAGKNLPSSASKPTTIYYQPVPSIDNPNTLNENLEAQNSGMGTDDEVLRAIEIWGENMLKSFHHQEKSRWIRMLLEGWISDRDVDAVVKVANATSASDLTKIRAEVDSSVKGMNTSAQRKRARTALGFKG